VTPERSDHLSRKRIMALVFSVVGAFGLTVQQVAELFSFQTWILVAGWAAVFALAGYALLPVVKDRRLRSSGQELMDIAVSMLEGTELELSDDSRELLSSDQSATLARFNTESVPKLARIARRLERQGAIDHGESKALTALVADMRSYATRLMELVDLARQLGASELRQVKVRKGETPSIAATVARMAALKERMEADESQSDSPGELT
jgi:hypothetical protein